MSSLYDSVVRIVNSSSKEEAVSLLFGNEGISVASQEYAEAVIAKFIRKKDQIIQSHFISALKPDGSIKYEKEFIFDLKREAKNVWNMMFLYQLFISEWQKDLAALNIEISQTKDKKERNRLVNKKNIVLSTIANYTSSPNTINNTSILNGESLSTDDLNRLKYMVYAFQTLRNKSMHRSENVSLGERLSINGSKFKLSVPIKYLDGFNSGRIIASHEDKDIVDKTNDAVKPLIEAVNFSPVELDSFIYNVSPRQLSFLLDICDNNIEVLYQMPIWCFDEKNRIILESVSGSKEKITPAKIKLLKSLNINSEVDPHNVVGLLGRFFDSDEEIDNILGYLNLVPPNMLNDPSSTFYVFEQLKGDKEKISETDLKMYSEILKRASIIYNKRELSLYLFNIVHFVNYFRKYNKNGGEFLDSEINLVSRLNVSGIVRYESIETLSRLINPFMKDGVLQQDAVEKIANFYNDFCSKKYLRPSESKQNKSVFLSDDLGTVEIIDDGDLYIYEGVPLIKDKTKENVISILDVLSRNGKKITLEEMDAVKKIPLIKQDEQKLVRRIFDVAQYLMGDEDRTLTEEEIKLLRGISVEGYLDEENDIIKRIDSIGNNPHALTEEEVNAIIYNQEEDSFSADVKSLLTNAYQKGKNEYVSVINTIYGQNLEGKDLPNLNVLLARVNGDYKRLAEFSRELFTVDSKVLDELLSNYDYNMCRSIFGLDNPKLIAIMIYASSVYSRCDEKVKSDLDIDPLVFINSAKEDTIRYAKTNGIPESFVTSFESQFLAINNKKFLQNFTEEGVMIYRIADHLRDASAHFFIEPAKDENGNIMENKMYVYNKDKNEKNFSVIIDMDKFVEITRKVEQRINSTSASVGTVPSTGKAK